MIPKAFIKIIKYFAYYANLQFLVLSIIFLSVSIFSWIDPPNSGISPIPVNEHKQYSVSVIFLLVTSASLFLLALLGLTSVFYSSTFFLSLYIFLLFLQISIQVTLSAFAITNRKNVHETIEKEWFRKLNTTTERPECATQNCGPAQLRSLIETEQFIFIIFLGFLSFQIITLIFGSLLCEALTRIERHEAMQKELEDEN